MFQESTDIFHFEKDRLNFEDLSHHHGYRHWRARDLMILLGYDDFSRTYIQEAIAYCNRIGIENKKNFQPSLNSNFPDYRLSKFACCLISMNCDCSKKEVENAKRYFDAMINAFHDYLREISPKSEDILDNSPPLKNKKTIALFNISYAEKKNFKNPSQMISFRFNE